MLPREAPPPIAALAPDVGWYATGLAKCVAPGLKIGYLAAPTAAAARQVEDTFYTTSTWHVSPLSAAIAQRWIADGTALRLMGAVREEAALRQQLAARILAGARFTTKPEALHLWLDLPRSCTQADFIAAAHAHGVELRSGAMFALDADRAPHALRVVVGSPETRETLEQALHALAGLLAAVPA
jgi:DNA-binding transcriptional MocR family regulator